jgi:hypothetical protein
MVEYVDVLAIILICPYSTTMRFLPTSRLLMFGICSLQWHTKFDDERIFDAKFSCDGELVYALFNIFKESVGIFDATACLQLRCRISRSAYIPANDVFLRYIY